jgi:hypothetical protein
MLFKKLCLSPYFKEYSIALTLLFLLASVLLLYGYLRQSEVSRLRGGLIFLLLGLIEIDAPGGLLIVVGSLAISLISFAKLFIPSVKKGFTSHSD